LTLIAGKSVYGEPEGPSLAPLAGKSVYGEPEGPEFASDSRKIRLW
jgi:hypothetical protein